MKKKLNITVLVDEAEIPSADPDNLTEHLEGERRFDKNIAALLEMSEIPFTGAGSMGMMLSRDKRLCKQLLSLYKIRVPAFISLPPKRIVTLPKILHFP